LTKSANIAKIDQEQLHMIYEKWPEHFKDAANMHCKLDHDAEFYRSVILCGMGGSATSCDILNDLLQLYGKISSTILRGHYMPFSIDKHSLVIVNSVSGNTQETIGMLEEASQKGAEVISISSGGKLKEISTNYGHKHIDIPNLGLPRASLPYLIMPGLKLIAPFLKISLEAEIPEIPRNLSKVANEISINSSEEFNTTKEIASFLQSGFAVCFTSPFLVSVGTRFKNSLNENAKVHCIKESVLEASHNEIVPFTYKNKDFTPKVLLLKWSGDPPIVTERFKKINTLFTQISQPLMEINISDKSLINAIISAIYILDYSTVFLAISRMINPSSTPAIDLLKRI
jgi:glucose/mannose-6-phosphate isomerase